MATPVVEATATHTEPFTDSTPEIDLPTGITSGDGLLIIGSINDAPTVTWPAGWTELADVQRTTSVTFAAAYRKADGTEGATVTPTLSAAEVSAWRSYRISGTDFATNPPEADAVSIGAPNSWDPNSFAPTHGTDDYLWIVGVAVDTYTAAVTSFSTGYTDTGELASSTSGAQCELVYESKSTTAVSSEDPGQIDWNNYRGMAGGVIAIPSDAVAGGISIPVVINHLRTQGVT